MIQLEKKTHIMTLSNWSEFHYDYTRNDYPCALIFDGIYNIYFASRKNKKKTQNIIKVSQSILHGCDYRYYRYAGN